jgi:hypothetical protein
MMKRSRISKEVSDDEEVSDGEKATDRTSSTLC